MAMAATSTANICPLSNPPSSANPKPTQKTNLSLLSKTQQNNPFFLPQKQQSWTQKKKRKPISEFFTTNKEYPDDGFGNSDDMGIYGDPSIELAFSLNSDITWMVLSLVILSAWTHINGGSSLTWIAVAWGSSNFVY